MLELGFAEIKKQKDFFGLSSEIEIMCRLMEINSEIDDENVPYISDTFMKSCEDALIIFDHVVPSSWFRKYDKASPTIWRAYKRVRQYYERQERIEMLWGAPTGKTVH